MNSGWKYDLYRLKSEDIFYTQRALNVEKPVYKRFLPTKAVENPVENVDLPT